MGCGISQSVLAGNDDRSKSDAFTKLCSAENNPLAMQLSSYLNLLMSECLYKSQGNTAGYERLLAKRPKVITVNRSRLAAQRHGIAHKPLTVDGVNDIMNVFLGHVIQLLDKRKWSGSFNYALKRPVPGSEAASDPQSMFKAMSTASSFQNRNPASSLPVWPSGSQVRPQPREKKVALAVPAAAPPSESGEPGSQPGLNHPLPGASAIQNYETGTATSRTTVASHAETLMFIDNGMGSRRDDDPQQQWCLELTGNITFPSVDGSLTLICDSKVAFLLFICDANIPAAPSRTSLAPNPLVTTSIDQLQPYLTAISTSSTPPGPLAVATEASSVGASGTGTSVAEAGARDDTEPAGDAAGIKMVDGTPVTAVTS